MAVTLVQSDAGFEERFAAFLSTKRESSPDVDATVREIIARVRAEGGGGGICDNPEGQRRRFRLRTPQRPHN